MNSSFGDRASGQPGECGDRRCSDRIAAKTAAGEGAAVVGGDFPRVRLFPRAFPAAESCWAVAEGLVTAACLWVRLGFGRAISGCHPIPVRSLIACLAPYRYFKDASSVKN